MKKQYRLVLTCFVFLFWSLSAQAQNCQEYFASEWGEPLQMSNPHDINTGLLLVEKNDLSSYTFENGLFSAQATGNDPRFRILTRATDGSIPDKTTRYGDLHPINPAKYSELVLRMYTDKPSALQVFWDKQDGSLGISAGVPTVAGWQTYRVNLNQANWGNGLNYGIRIDPSSGAPGATIIFDYIYLVPQGCTDPDLRIAPILQPDREGGEDYFAFVRQNSANMDSPTDFDWITGNSSASIFPAKQYIDSGGTVRRQDYLEAVSNSNDPAIGFVFPGTTHSINAARYKIACWTFDILRPSSVFHSMVRLIWQVDGAYYNTDDILTAVNGEARYCVRLEGVQLEPLLPPGQPHPWRKNSNGSGIDLLRFDPLEDPEPTTYRLIDMRLSADHEADRSFAIVIGGDRSAAVTVYALTESGSRLRVGALPSGRTSDVLVWNTSAVSELRVTLHATGPISPRLIQS